MNILEIKYHDDKNTTYVFPLNQITSLYFTTFATYNKENFQSKLKINDTEIVIYTTTKEEALCVINEMKECLLHDVSYTLNLDQDWCVRNQSNHGILPMKHALVPRNPNIGTEKELEKYMFILDNNNNRVILEEYISLEPEVTVYGQYEVNGTIYNTYLIATKIFTENAIITKVTIKDGVSCCNEDGTTSEVSMKDMFHDCDEVISLDLSGLDTSEVTDMHGMFCHCEALTSLKVSGWNTSKVRDMSIMFCNCRALPSLDLSEWDTSNVLDMTGMFSNCKSLTSLEVSGWNTANVTSMENMFFDCKALTSLDLSEWDTAKVRDMNYMFFNCKELSSLDVSNWDTSKVKDMSDMFYGCKSLKEINVSSTWTITKGCITRNMFADCGVSEVNITTKETEELQMEKPSIENTNIGTKEELEAYDYLLDEKHNEVVLQRYTSIKPEVVVYGQYEVEGTVYDTYLVAASVFRENTIITKVTIKDGVSCCNEDGSTSEVSMKEMFYDCEEVISLNLSGLDTSEVTDMSGMFYNCSALTSLKVSNWDTSKVTNMDFMFYNCKALTSLDLSGLDTSKVTNMSGMFYGCESLHSLNLSGWNTSKVRDMSHMFYRCKALTSLDVSNWDTSKVKDMKEMFYGCEALKEINVSPLWTITNGCITRDMFADCGVSEVKITTKETGELQMKKPSIENTNIGTKEELGKYRYTLNDKDKKVILKEYISSEPEVTVYSQYLVGNTAYDTYLAPHSFTKNKTITRVTVTSGVKLHNSRYPDTLPILANSMFAECTALTSVDVSGLDTSNVVDMNGMFADCVSLTSINVSGLNTSKVEDMHEMFYNCKSLTSLDLTSFNTYKASTLYRMFYGCSALTEVKVSSLWRLNLDRLYGENIMDMFTDCGVSEVTVVDKKPPILGMMEELGEYEYFLDEKEKTVTLLDYLGTNPNVVVCGGYLVQGEIYQTYIVNNTFYPASNILKSVIITPGVKCGNDDCNHSAHITTGIPGLFTDCKHLTFVDISGLDTSNVTDMSCMFCDCKALTSLDLSKLDTSKVTNMSHMFSECRALPSLDVSGFDTSKVEDMRCMFYRCEALTSLDLSGWDTAKVKYMSNMFHSCEALTGIKVSSTWTVTKDCVTRDMFADCGVSEVTMV